MVAADAGSDVYLRPPRVSDLLRAETTTLSLAQGFGYGRRPYAYGGIGLLVDRTGNDRYAAEVFGQYLAGAATDHLRELAQRERERIFNLGYYTWVEQQGIDIETFMARKRSEFWVGLRDRLARWDRLIEAFNTRTGVAKLVDRG